MRYFFDFEFIENGAKHPMIPISIGIVSEDGDEYYAEFTDVDWSLANQWVLDNVRPYLQGKDKTRKEIASDVKEFVGESPEFWAYFADYDWVILCQLYGRMIDLPKSWPFYCLDIKQYMWHFGISKEDITIGNEQEHDALADARWNRGAFAWMIAYQESVQS